MRLSPERTVLAVGLLGGLLFAFATPPFQSPDEPAHFRRIYQIAGGAQLQSGPRGEPGIMQPASLEKIIALCLAGLPGEPRRLLPQGVVRAAWSVPLDPERQVFVPLANLTAYNPVSYLPQAAAAAVCRWLALRPLATLYGVRLANLVFCLAVVCAAVRMVPQQKWAFALLALTPMAMFLRSSASPDGLTFATALLLTGTVSAIALGRSAVPQAAPEYSAAPTAPIAPIAPAAPTAPAAGLASARLVACLLAMTGVMAFCKVGYVLVNLLVGAIPRRRFRSWQRWGAVMGAAFALSLLGTWNSARIARFYTAHFRRLPSVQPLAQLQLALAQPLHFLGLVIADYWLHLIRYAVGFIGNFGWLDTPLPVFVLVLYAALLIGLALTGGDAATPMPRGVRLMAAAVVVGGLLLLSTSQYLCWTPIGSQHIDGLQGRYFLPLGAAGVLLLYNRRLSRHGAAPPNEPARANRLAFTSATVTAASLVALWVRYHGW